VTGHDDEFDDFLARRRKLFRRPEDDLLEPPDEVDRIVLRQAREAIESRGTEREIRGMGWGAPLALAASLLVAFTILLNVGMSQRNEAPQVSVDQVSQRHEQVAPPAASPPLASRPAEQAVSVPGLVSDAESRRYAPEPPPPPPPVLAQERGAAAAATAADTPAFRRDAASWLAEIQRLRAEGRNAEADAELAAYKRQHKAYAVSPDR
jgi:hypothetical protein